MKQSGYYLEWRDFDEGRAWNDPDPRVWKLWCRIRQIATHRKVRICEELLEPGEALTSYASLARRCSGGGGDDTEIPAPLRFSREWVRNTIRRKLVPWGYVVTTPSVNATALKIKILRWAEKQVVTQGRPGVDQGLTQGLTQGRPGVDPHTITENRELETEKKRGDVGATPVPTPTPSAKKAEPWERPPSVFDEMRPLARGAYKTPPACPNCGRPLSWWETRSGSRQNEDKWHCDEKTVPPGCGKRFLALEWIDPGSGGKLTRKSRPPVERPSRAREDCGGPSRIKVDPRHFATPPPQTREEEPPF